MQIKPEQASDNENSRMRRLELHVAENVAKKAELKAFLFLTVVMAPALAGAIIGLYGLAVWVYQMVMGPPTG